MQPSTLQVAVSYSHHDAACVITDIERLAKPSIGFWMDRNITGGVVWREEIAQNFGAADLVMAFISKSWLESEYCRQEISYALDHGKPILCIYIDDTLLTPGLQMSLNHRQTIARYQYSHNLNSYYQLADNALSAFNHKPDTSQRPAIATQMTTRMLPRALHLIYNSNQYDVTTAPNTRFTLGRSSECNLVLKSDFVSRVHGYVYFSEGKYHYQDTSSNGTQLLSNANDLHLQQDSSELATVGQIIMGGAIINYHTQGS